MRVFDFQLKGLTRDEFQRRRNRAEQLRFYSAKYFSRFWMNLAPVTTNVIWLLSALLGLYSLQWVYVFAERQGPSTIAYGQAFTGKNVIVLEDTSGSMGPEEKIRLAALLNQLKAAGIKVNATSETKGAGFWTAGEDVNSLKSLERALRTNPTADTIFVFSDFKHDDPEWDDHDQAGFQRLRELLEQRTRRLYLGTVNRQPDPELIRIATDSGGGLLEIK